MTDRLRVAIYTRYSSDLSRDASIDDQLHRCHTHATASDWQVVGTFADRALSGATLLRPGYQDMMQAVRTGGIDVVLAEALDRLSRDQEDIAALFKRLRFIDVRLITVAEGEIGELHIGLKGTMNALYLKDLADKTRRGLVGRIRKGRSAGGLCYGYDVVAGEERGGRTINETGAAVVRRIFGAFAAGRSPKGIARQLNDQGITGPRGGLWRDTAIRGHRQRGTGILNNELYIGRLVRNRLRYVKDSATGRRLSRPNPPEDWVVDDVPDLRIVSDALWQRVKDRQAEIDATPAVQAIRQSRFWERRRATHLLSGLLQCGACGGGFAAVGRDYLACSNARKLGICDARTGIRRAALEECVLDLTRGRLMQPAAVEAFIAAYHQEINSGRDAEAAQRRATERQLRQVTGKLDGLYDAIADGLRSPGLMARLEALEAEKENLEQELAAPAPLNLRLHPGLRTIYRAKVEQLAVELQIPAIRDEALGLLRSLIDRVVLHHDADGWEVELEGDISALVSLGSPGSRIGTSRVSAALQSSVKVVAGRGFEPLTFRL